MPGEMLLCGWEGIPAYRVFWLMRTCRCGMHSAGGGVRKAEFTMFSLVLSCHKA